MRTLNRLGHGVSYTQVEDIDTALCLQNLDRSQTGVALPSNIYQGVFTTSGEGTSQRVNRIAVQPRIIGPMPQGEAKTTTKKSKKRSMTPPPAALPMYNTGRRVGPAVTVTLDVDADKQVQDARVKNMIWLLTRLSNPEEDQTISSWTGFNLLIRNDTHVMQDTMSYLPIINAPTTEM